MVTERVQVVVIGGGATGTGILRDLAMRGLSALLVEQGDLAHGTSSRFHGLLHSGGRYAVKDKEAAKECIEENLLLRRLAPDCIEPTGGLFAQLPSDDPAYAETWVKACAEAGIETKELDVGALIQKYPVLSPKITRAYSVPDAAVDGFRMLWSNVNSARRYGAKMANYSKLTAIHQTNGRISGVELTNTLTGEARQIECDMVINAAGAWAGEVTTLAGLDVSIIKDKGTLLAFNHRLTNQVVNRLRPPGDADIFVPHGTITLLGTTSVSVDDPNSFKTTDKEVQDMLAVGREMMPRIDDYRIIRAFAGVRPLYQANKGAGGRAVTRNFALIDHEQRDGLTGLISIVGGKFTTFRLMAEKTVDLAAKKLGNNTPCRTKEEPLSAPQSAEMLERGKKVFGVPGAKKAAERLGEGFAKVVAEAEQDRAKRRMFCECEMVSAAEIEYVADDDDSKTLSDIRRRTRMGMGTCQGIFCSYRTLGAMSDHKQFTVTHREFLAEFLQNRWRGVRAVLWGQQLREAQLSSEIFCTLFGMERMK